MRKIHPTFIEVEINTFCNRQCPWCPNSTSDRGTVRKPIDDGVWWKLLDDLRTNDYTGWIAFHNYNEPLADPTIFTKVTETKQAIPLAKTAVYTNGDYWQDGQIERLIELMVDEVRITLYPWQNGTPKMPGWNEIGHYINNVLHAHSWQKTESPSRYEGRFTVAATRFVVVSPQVAEYNNRAGNLSSEVNDGLTHRLMPCYLPSWAAAIDVDGNLKLCCNIYNVNTDVEKVCNIGNLKDSTFFELWHSQKLMKIRRQLARADTSGLEPCERCNFRMRSDDERDACALFQEHLSTCAVPDQKGYHVNK